MDVVHILPGLAIPLDEIEISFSRSSGPGGQNVNKLNTKAQLRFSVTGSSALDDGQRMRIKARLGPRITKEGELILTSQAHRTAEQNRADAIEKFQALLSRALKRRKKRIPTKPSRQAEERRLQSKKQRSEKKRRRRPPRMDG